MHSPFHYRRPQTGAGDPRSRWGRVLFGAILVVVIANFAAVPFCPGQEIIDQQREYNVKSVFLYSFGRYVTWPESAFDSQTSAFTIGVLGETPVVKALGQIAAKRRINERNITVKSLRSISELDGCHIVFVSQRVDSQTQLELLQTVANKPVLVVGESPGYAEEGASISFVIEGSAVRFKINRAVAQQNGLAMNAKLLRLGKLVQR